MSTLTPQVRASLLAIYAELEQEVKALAPVCELSGRCCRFEEYGHRLYITQPEADLLLEQGLPPNSEISSAGCPFQIGNMCTARERRPFGCRVYFCDPKYEGHAPELSEAGIHKLKRLHQIEQIPWNYAELVVHLEEYVERTEGSGLEEKRSEGGESDSKPFAKE